MTHSSPTQRSSDLVHALAALVRRQHITKVAVREEIAPREPVVCLGARGGLEACEERRVNALRAELLDELVVVDPSHTANHRSEEHTSELQSLMRTTYAVFCLKKTTTT